MARVLIVEDEPVVRAIIKRIVESAGHTAIEASSIQEIRNMEPAPQVALLDLNLDDSSGEETVPRCAAVLPKGTPIIVLTGTTDAQKIRGALRVLHKPIDVQESEVVKAIEAALGPEEICRTIRDGLEGEPDA